MVYVYFDASALVKRYSKEDGTELVNELFDQLPANQMTCAMIGILEIISVLVRKRNDGRLSTALFDRAMLQFKKEIIENKDFAISAIDDDLMLSALDLIEPHNINATDTIVLRSSLIEEQIHSQRGDQVVLWSCDKRLLRAAQQEGMQIFDPEVGTLSQLQSTLNPSPNDPNF